MEDSRKVVNPIEAEIEIGALPQLMELSASCACNSGGIGGLQLVTEKTTPANIKPRAEFFKFFKGLVP
jgi:hypothetical protein